MLELLAFRSAAVFKVETIPADACGVKHLYEILNQAPRVVVACFIPTLAGISGNDKHAIGALGERPHNHIGRDTRCAGYKDGQDRRGILCPDSTGHVRRPVASFPADVRGDLRFERHMRYLHPTSRGVYR